MTKAALAARRYLRSNNRLCCGRTFVTEKVISLKRFWKHFFPCFGVFWRYRAYRE